MDKTTLEFFGESYITVQYRTYPPYNNVLYRTLPYYTVQYRTIPHRRGSETTDRYCTVLYGVVRYSRSRPSDIGGRDRRRSDIENKRAFKKWAVIETRKPLKSYHASNAPFTTAGGRGVWEEGGRPGPSPPRCNRFTPFSPNHSHRARPGI